MSQCSRAPQVTEWADGVLQRVGILKNPYFAAIQEGRLTAAGFLRSQEQFFFAVTFFPRPMAALVGRIPDPKARLDILRNLVEEHGEFDEEAFHHTTFQRFLRTLGTPPGQLDTLTLAPAVRAFNSVLTAACVLDDLEVGVGCMGIIEHAFSPISALIGQAVVQHGWVKREELVHYQLHAEIDQRHAEEFFAILEPRWFDPPRRYLIEQGLELGAHAFDRLYRELHLIATQ